MQFVKNDPLQHRQIPLSWVNALAKWNEKIEKAQENTTPILILQGEKDTTVDWKYNLPFLQGKFPNATIQFFKKGRHHLLNEEKQTRNKVFSAMGAFLLSDC